MKNVLDAIKSQGWTFGEFLYRLFRCKDEDQAPRLNQHAQILSKFFKGEGDYTPSDILTCWMTNPYGAIPANSPQSTDMYSTTTPYTAICSVRTALTSFALQTVGEHLARGAEKAVQGSNVVESHLAAVWYLMDLIAAPKPRTRDGVKLPPRKSRPSRGVIIHALADLLFCRSSRANLLPVARGILYFGSSVPVEIMAYNCRIGTMPSLEGLSTEEALVTLNHGRDQTKAGIRLFDNVQNLARIRDLRIGRENHMNVGMSGLWVEASDSIDVAVFENDKRRFIANSQRADLTVDTLLGFLDQEEADATGYLEWMEVLVRCTKPLNHYTAEVSARYRPTAKLDIPLLKCVVHPLATSGKKQTIPSELKDGLLDFLAQVGQLPTDYILRKLIHCPNRCGYVRLGPADATWALNAVIIGGDGLSYAMVLQLQAYLQFHKDPFKSFEILEPQLQTHWGRVSGKSTNPASLGHSAGKIGRAAPSNMRKVEFYPGSQLVHLVLDARMLDCWRLLLGTEDVFEHFAKLAEAKRLPAFDELVVTAQKLHQTYATARARDHAIFDTDDSHGSIWVPIDVEDSSLDQTKKKKSKGKKKEKSVPPRCTGDFVLAQCVDFLRDAINLRKVSFAVAEGDVGRLYGCIKYMLFTFAGSTHSNYMGYILEMIINLELESSPGLKEALLLCLLINLTGLAGHFEEGDYVVEFFNRLTEDVVQHKNAQFDDNFIRNVVSRNLRHIAELKLAWRTGTGMAQKSKKHTDPHSNPEMLILLKTYRDEQLHSRRLGRQIDDRDTDNFAQGIKKLRTGGLDKWIKKSLRTRQTKRPAEPVTPATVGDASDDSGDECETSSDESSDSDSDAGHLYATQGSMAVIDGQLVMDDRDMMLGPDGSDEMLGPEGRDEEEEEEEEELETE
ncbi:hypothetical protein B0H17DRAFT_1160508 [Mycena rosella]|uniref:DUF6589 domain-containing protein n=1 Tax=Mycena rosella TaxID=1033263 RepID=A0AAD7DAF8_MYCRO|nr:hypothetical protein B0H17DRAFT_1160508 [Mycena rosella]